jgi:3-deoxy-D-manno-octulosonate 8-phosphate phosphatase (KDO 8-P phosphatase)
LHSALIYDESVCMNVLELFKNITAFVFDVDGVLTDGMLLLLPGGAMVRKMNIKDGYALQAAVKKNYPVIIISGGFSPETEERLRKLGVTEVYMRCENKKKQLQNIINTHGLRAEELIFMGDDIPDYEAMQIVGLACCPADAATEIKEIAKYISPLKGGEGCARDVIERVLKLRGDWEVDTQLRAQ